MHEMFKILLELYLLNIICVGAHESGHVIVANLFGCNVRKITLGYEKIGIAISKLTISPIIISGYTEIDNSFRKQYQVILYFLAGIIVNIIFAGVVYWGCKVNLVSLAVIFMNCSQVIISALPFIEGSDIYNMIYAIKNWQSKC